MRLQDSQGGVEYAQKHFETVIRLIPKDQKMDYLSGNAGAIVAALKLYKITGRTEYCEIATKAEKEL